MSEKSFYTPVEWKKDEGVADVTPDESVYHVNRCLVCGRLITKLEILDLFAGRTKGNLCTCGGMAIRPGNIKLWEWILPRVWKLAWAVITKKIKPAKQEVELPQ